MLETISLVYSKSWNLCVKFLAAGSTIQKPIFLNHFRDSGRECSIWQMCGYFNTIKPHKILLALLCLVLLGATHLTTTFSVLFGKPLIHLFVVIFRFLVILNLLSKFLNTSKQAVQTSCNNIQLKGIIYNCTSVHVCFLLLPIFPKTSLFRLFVQ